MNAICEANLSPLPVLTDINIAAQHFSKNVSINLTLLMCPMDGCFHHSFWLLVARRLADLHLSEGEKKKNTISRPFCNCLQTNNK